MSLIHLFKKLKHWNLDTSCTNTHHHHDVTDLANHGMVKIQKLEYLRTKHNFSQKQKNCLPVSQMTHFEKLLFCTGSGL